MNDRGELLPLDLLHRPAAVVADELFLRPRSQRPRISGRAMKSMPFRDVATRVTWLPTPSSP